MTARDAYKQWKSLNKVDMQVKTDEQMFEIGYNWRNDEVKDLEELVIALSDRVEIKNDKRKAKEDNTAVSEQLGSDLPKKKRAK
jgi:predicted N-acyltransferase